MVRNVVFFVHGQQNEKISISEEKNLIKISFSAFFMLQWGKKHWNPPQEKWDDFFKVGEQQKFSVRKCVFTRSEKIIFFEKCQSTNFLMQQESGKLQQIHKSL